MTEDLQEQALFEAERSEVRQAGAVFAGSVKRRLALWAIRWTIGFVAIGIAVYLEPTLAWLLWAGAGLAGASLIVTLTVHGIMRRRLGIAEYRIDENERIAREAEQQASEQEID